MTSRLTLTALVVLASTVFRVAAADACSCASSGPPCEATWAVDAVFSGRVRSIERVPDVPDGQFPAFLRITFDVEQGFVNAQPGPIVVTTPSSGAACGYDFTEGHRYLVYASRRNSAELSTGICTRTRPLEEARGDLAYLMGLGQQPARSRVYGRVKRWHRDPFEAEGADYGPVENVLVSVRATAFSRDVFTDRNGRYEVLDVPTGPLTITLVPGFGYQAGALEREAELLNRRACIAGDFTIVQVAAASGTIVDAQDRPLAGVLVDAVASELAGYSPPPFQRPARTDASGRFEFENLPPGEYVFGVNLTANAGSRASGPPIFFPGTATPADAIVFTLNPGDHGDIGQLRLTTTTK